MNKNIKVIGSYRCGCTYGPIYVKDRLEYCAIHGSDIQNEYEVFSPKKGDEPETLNANTE